MPVEIIYEDEEVLAFIDINGLALVYVLIIPKKHIELINDLENKENRRNLIGKLIMTAQGIAKERKITSDGYKSLFRVNKYG